MDFRMHLQHLALAERHIARGEEHIFKQELRIADFEHAGHDTVLARSLLDTFCLVQQQHIAHRNYILKELEA